MHELDIAQRIVDSAVAELERQQGSRVVTVTISVGRLAAVDVAALRSAFEHAVAGTPLDDAQLDIREVAVVIWCAHCLAEVMLDGHQSLRCPTCDTPAGEIRAGRELRIESVEIAD